ncbi:hypothetical protein H0C30_001854 [Salmonella enterica]|nr:hypothetical protein [Salmonella enterica]
MQSYAGGEGGIGIKKIPAIRQGFKILSFLSLQAGYVASCRAFSAAFDIGIKKSPPSGRDSKF